MSVRIVIEFFFFYPFLIVLASQKKRHAKNDSVSLDEHPKFI